MTGAEEDILYDFFVVYEELVLQQKYTDNYAIEFKFNDGNIDINIYQLMEMHDINST